MVKKDKGDREKTKGKCYWEEKERVYQLSGLTRQSRFATVRYKFITLSDMDMN